MKLKTIRLAGFKTFVDPTTLHLRAWWAPTAAASRM